MLSLAAISSRPLVKDTTLLRHTLALVNMHLSAILEHICRQSKTIYSIDSQFSTYEAASSAVAVAITQVAASSSDLSFEIDSFLYVEAWCYLCWTGICFWCFVVTVFNNSILTVCPPAICQQVSISLLWLKSSWFGFVSPS